METQEIGYGTVTFEDSEGNQLELMVLDYFFFNGQEIAVLADKWCGEGCPEQDTAACEACDVTIFYMTVKAEGDEETFEPIEDEKLLQQLDDAYHSGEA